VLLAGDAASKVTGAAGDVASGGGGLLRKILPVAAIAILGFFGLKMFGGGSDVEVPDVDTSSIEMPKVEMPEMPGLPDGVGDELNSSFSGASEALGGITDVDSAKAALPALDGLTGTLDKIPEAARGPLSGLLGNLTRMSLLHSRRSYKVLCNAYS